MVGRGQMLSSAGFISFSNTTDWVKKRHSYTLTITQAKQEQYNDAASDVAGDDETAQMHHHQFPCCWPHKL